MKYTYSIKDENTFQKLINKGKWYGGNYISLYVLKNNKEINQIAYGVGKKVGKAFKRNYVKRIIRESYTKLESAAKTGYSLFFVCKNKADFDNITYDDIYKDVYNTLKKAGIID